MKIDRSRKTLRVLAVVAAASAALAACSSQGGAPASQPAAGGGGGGGTGQSYTIAMITHEAAGDSFWDKIRAGAEQAAKDTGVTLKYSNDQDSGQEATLVQNAIDSKVDGIAVTLAYPDAVGPAAQKAIQAGIPVVAFNSGINNYQQYGIPMYFGSDEDAGRPGRRDEAVAGRRRQGHLRDPGAGPGRAGDPLRRREEDLPEHREPAGQRHRPAVGAADHRRQAAAGPVDQLGRHPRRAATRSRARRRRRTPAARPRSPRST